MRDKAMRQDPYVTQDQHRDQVRQYEASSREWRTPAEKAGDPTPGELAAIDAARAAWTAAQETAGAAGREVQALRRRVADGSQVIRRRDGHGGYFEETAVDVATLRELKVSAQAAETTFADAQAAALRAQRAFNRVNIECGRAATARRAAAQRELNITAYLDRKRAAGQDVDERRIRATWGRGEGEGVRVRLDSGAVQGEVESIPAVRR